MSLFVFIIEELQKNNKVSEIPLAEGIDAILPGYSPPKIDSELLYGHLVAKDIEIVG